MQTRQYGDEAFIRERICAAEKAIAAIEAAQLTVAAGATSYSLDDGQTRQTVTKASVSELKNALDAAILNWDMWRSRLNGPGPNIRPGW